ncbi:MAG: hypothetical protein ACAI25_21055 [Planctomycetota bacterium]
MRPTKLNGVALVLLLAFASVARAQDADLLTTGNQIARFNKPGALYGFLRDAAPEFFKVADAGGLAEALDGGQDASRFEARFAQLLAASKLSAADKAKARAQSAIAFGVIETLRAQTGPKVGITAAQARSGASVEVLRDGLWDAKKHWLNDVWDARHVNSVPIAFKPAEFELAWTNPRVLIPELGIRPGVALTADQAERVVGLFGVVSDPHGRKGATHSAAAPTHVGRAVNPNPTLTVVVGGDVRNDLVVKGGGPNATTTSRDGLVDFAEAMFETQFAENLDKAGVKNYDALFVLRSKTNPEKAVLVRVPRTPLRAIDLLSRNESGMYFENDDALEPKELKATLEHLANEAAIREGKAGMSIAEWLGDWLPRNVGKNVGILSELGIDHGRLKYVAGITASNHGLGEMVDWGDDITKKTAGSPDQRGVVFDVVKAIIEHANAVVLGAREKVNVAEARKKLDAAFDEAKAATSGEGHKFLVDPKVVDHLSDDTLRKFTGESSRDRAVAALPLRRAVERASEARGRGLNAVLTERVSTARTRTRVR